MRPKTQTHSARRPSGLGLMTLASAAALAAGGARAQAPTPLPAVRVQADAELSRPVDASSLGEAALANGRAATSDTARLLGTLPGVALQTGGAVSSLPVLRGLADDRVRILTDGMTAASACANHMNPPLSYVDPTNVGRATVLPGVTPVSLGGDSIGGTILVDTPPPAFATEAESPRWDASVSTFYRSNGDSITTAGTVGAATQRVSLGYAGSWAQGHDYVDGNGNKVLSTNYQTANHQGTLGVQGENSLFVLKGGVQIMPYQGFPNQRMDLKGNHSSYVNGSYTRDLGWGKVDLRLWWQDVRHYMNFLADKGGDATGGMPMKTHGTTLGYRVKLDLPVGERHLLRVGSDLEALRLKDWWPPVGTGMMSPNTYLNINNGTRTRLGVFGEWEARWTDAWSTLLGARIDTVWMDTGTVQPYSWTSMMSAADIAAAKVFNAQNRARTDVNLDLTALTRYEATETLTGEFGYARKTRSPNLYERYAWGAGNMAQSMIGWFGDVNYYRGNIDLKPEVAHTVSVSAVWHDAAKESWEARITPYYTYVDDFIGVTRVGSLAQGGTTIAKLQFANRDAQIYGVDVSGRAVLWRGQDYGTVGVQGVIGWLQGNYIDSGKSLYHMMPLNAQAALTHQLGGWTSRAELRLVAPKALVDGDRYEPSTPGFAVMNLRTSYEWRNVRLDFAIENLLNQQYYEPLGGVDYADWRATGRVGELGSVPAPGRTFIAGVTFRL
ncbi:TonB-dependent receptor plug domain-containing protein [Rhodovastum atsumiense]|uniref:TonB-dependent receptor n=1 Tax=Rhodovastum atsumiense TaxID=504468 RepID=UPI00139F2B3D|nr:TonB-dependent receptor [Rhodovastum atsumiense]CAH2602512.1 TonB-dependent receptor plug domain-containing protein [Rhodovastum atsumiense]